MPNEETVQRWLSTMLPAALERGPRGGTRIVLQLTPMTDTATGEPSLIVNGRPLRPFDIEPLLGTIGRESCALLRAARSATDAGATA